jgi:L-alanine-DL-glutamate epimerase-like enolase superfamily enzyme
MRLSISCAPLPLALVHAFGTSHSTTLTRTNCLVTVAHSPSGKEGRGEAGLPPVKEKVYYAGVADVMEAVDLFKAFAAERVATDTDDLVAQHLAWLDEWRRNAVADAPRFRPAVNALECALLDLQSQLSGTKVHALLGIAAPPRSRGYVTVSIERDPEIFARTLQEATVITSFIKLKCDRDLAYAERAMRATADALHARPGWAMCVDANAAWDPATALAFLELAKRMDLAARITMLEQPFPVVIPEGDLAAWTAVRDAGRAAKVMNGNGFFFSLLFLLGRFAAIQPSAIKYSSSFFFLSFLFFCPCSCFML